MRSDVPNLELFPPVPPYHPRTPYEGGVRQGVAGGAVVVPNLKYGSSAKEMDDGETNTNRLLSRAARAARSPHRHQVAPANRRGTHPVKHWHAKQYQQTYGHCAGHIPRRVFVTSPRSCASERTRPPRACRPPTSCLIAVGASRRKRTRARTARQFDWRTTRAG